jgi:CxxC motif-containing protein (DUF1111 family)
MLISRRFYFNLLPFLLILSCNQNDGDQGALHFTDALKLGGDTTDENYSNSGHAYSVPALNLDQDALEKHLSGDAAFETAFTTSPVTDEDFKHLDGKGPVQNHSNCNACHQRDGRGNLPVLEHKELLNSYILKDKNGYYKLGNSSAFLRISIENETTATAEKSELNHWGAPVPVPNFSDQLFHRGSSGVRLDGEGLPTSQGSGQADVWMKYEYRTVVYPDGTKVELSKPLFFVDNPYDAPDDPDVYNPIVVSETAKSRLFRTDVKLGARIGLPVFGLGLVGAIKDEDILALADPDDKDGDGISGKPNMVFDVEKYQVCAKEKKCVTNPPISLGKYGWKANTPTAAHQGLGALRGDMGVTNPLFPDESIEGTDLMKLYKEAYPDFAAYKETEEGKVEASLQFSEDVVFYTETLHVPARRNIDDEDVRAGGKLFETIGCAKCHTPSFTTGEETSFSMGGKHIPSVENQVIYPFSDMLLHDMGDDLADHRRDFQADGNEWKTRQLWGIGMTQRVNPGAGFLHDGRARTLEEAILWHGGESEQITQEFMNRPKDERSQLIKFLESL